MTGEKFTCTSKPARTKSSTAVIRSAIGDVRTSTTLATLSGISEKRIRVVCCGSYVRSFRFTNLVANDPLALGKLAEGGDEVLSVIANQSIDAKIHILAKVIDP